MTQSASLSAPPSRTRRIVLVALVLGLVGVAVVLRRPLLMSAPTCLAGQWERCLRTENGVLFMMLVTVPLSVLLAWVLARRRRGAAAWRMSLAEVGMVHGTVPLLWMTMMPGEGAGVVPGRLSLVPFRDLATMGLLGIVANLLIFAALGFFAPVRFAALASVPRVLALGAVCSILVETAQYAFQLDRVSSVDDVLLNATGAALAALASRHWWRARTEA
ncbi:MAG TPA: VanZ family protein [Umezawaea sp.]|nr:VanZ family protein [Umezawaea sp.]